MKLAIVGSRGFKDTRLLESILDKHKDTVSIVVSGGAIGADTMGETWAIANKIPIKIFKPEWEKYGKSAGMKRNELIIQECDICIAFWDGKSKGTANSIFICKKLNKKVEVIRYDN
jgi:hypothetical protein